MKLIDANVVLRYLLNDHPEYSVKAKNLIENEDNLLLIEVIAEIVYVLQGVYQIPRPVICQSIKSLASLEKLEITHSEIVIKAVELYAELNIDFIDCVLIAYHKCQNIGINTFDKKILKYITQATSL